MKKQTIGILAGMGPYSTSSFINLILSECQEQYGAKDDIDYPKMTIYSLPAPFYIDRPIDHEKMEEVICEGLQDLERFGVSFTAIACNTAHIYYPQLEKCINSPLLNMIELALNAIPSSSQKIALITAQPTAESKIYQNGIRESGYDFIDIKWQQQVNNLIESARTISDSSELEKLWCELTTMAKERGVDTILIACLDLSAIAKYIKGPIHILDTARSLAKEVVAQWLSQSDQDNFITSRRENFILSTDKKKLQINRVHHFLSTQAYWSLNIPYKNVAASIEHSLCFGLYDEGLDDCMQIGFARVITDKTTFAWICDVYVESSHRRNGLAKWMIENVMKHPDLKGLRRICLATKDAHNLYTQYGFEVTKSPNNWMEIKAINPYGKTAR